MNSGVHALTDDEVIKSPFHKNNEGTSKRQTYHNDLIIRVCQKDTMVLILCSYSKIVDLNNRGTSKNKFS